jgi:hypothetical protein
MCGAGRVFLWVMILRQALLTIGFFLVSREVGSALGAELRAQDDGFEQG